MKVSLQKPKNKYACRKNFLVNPRMNASSYSQANPESVVFIKENTFLPLMLVTSIRTPGNFVYWLGISVMKMFCRLTSYFVMGAPFQFSLWSHFRPINA